MELVTNASMSAADQAIADVRRDPARVKSLSALATFMLSEAGRKASLLAGGDGKALQTVTIDVPASRLHLVSVDRQGVARLRLRPRFELDSEQRVGRVDSSPAFDTPPRSEELLRLAATNHELEQAYHSARTAATLSRHQAHRELREQVAQAFLADQGQRAVVHPPPTHRSCVVEADGRRIVFDVSVDPVWAKRVAIEATRRFRADQRARRENNLHERAKQLALHEEKKRFVADWIAEHGTPEQQARQAAGMLPMAEAVASIADHGFARASGYRTYARTGWLKLQEALRTDPEHATAQVRPADVIAQTSILNTATAEQWKTIEALRTLFPGAAVTLMRQELKWRPSQDAVKLQETFVAVTVKVGPMTVRRDFEID